MAAQAELRIEVSDPGLTQSLSSFLEHTIYRPGPPAGRIVSVTGPEGLSVLIARAELNLYLEAWRRFHPEVSASLID
jgi:hypothetical protein